MYNTKRIETEFQLKSPLQGSSGCAGKTTRIHSVKASQTHLGNDFASESARSLDWRSDRGVAGVAPVPGVMQLGQSFPDGRGGIE